MREILGIACLVAAVVAVGVLVVVRRRGAIIPAIVVAAALVVAAAALLVPAHYSIAARTRHQIVAAPGSTLTAEIKNGGLLSGTFHAALAVDGVSGGDVSVAVDGHGARTVELPLPGALAPGRHTLTVAGRSLAFTALRPADFHVGRLQLAPDIAKVHTPIVVIAEVTNRGEATGVFPGDLDVNGRAAQTKPVSIAGGASKSLTFQIERAKPGTYALRLGDSPRSRIAVVKPFRPANGAVLARSSSGQGRLTFQDKMQQDCVAVLSSNVAGGRHPAVAFYIRAGSSATVTGVGDGFLYVYYTSGSDWNRTTRDFLETGDRERFKRPIVFSTSSWTTSYTDWSAWTIYTTRHTQYTGWTIKVSDAYVWGPKGGTVNVTTARFPRV